MVKEEALDTKRTLGQKQHASYNAMMHQQLNLTPT